MQSERVLSQDEDFLGKLTKIVLENISDENFGVEQLAREIGLSRSQLYRRIKLLKGQSISRFIREIKMDEAMKLLKSDVASISEIAYRLGYKSPSYFHKCFVEQFGETPTKVKSRKAGIGITEFVSSDDKVKRKNYITNRTIVLVLLVVAVGMFLMIDKRSDSSKIDDNLKSIAVLPLKTLSKNSNDSYLTLGLHDAIIGELGKLSGLRVISKTSTLPFTENTKKILPEIADKLGVQLVLEGSIFVVGDSLRLQIQLIEVFPNEKHIWAQEYYEKIDDVLTIQSDLVQDIASKVDVKLTLEESEMLETGRSINPETYKNFLRGMYYINSHSNEDIRIGINHLKKAIQFDPADPFAYSGLALGYALSGHGPTGDRSLMKLAKSAAIQALKIDKNMSNAHVALGMVYLYEEWNWEKSEQSFNLALKITPNNEFAHAHLAWLYLLLDKHQLAIKHASLAKEINPLYPVYQLWLAWIYKFIDEDAFAIGESKKLLENEPNFSFAHFIIASVYYDEGNYTQAIEQFEKIGFKNDIIQSGIGGAYAKLEETKKAEEILSLMKGISPNQKQANPVYTAFLFAALEEKDSAMIYLNKAYDEKLYPLQWVKYADAFKTMEKDSAFIDLYKRMNLPL